MGSTLSCGEEVFHTSLRGPEVSFIVLVTPQNPCSLLGNPLECHGCLTGRFQEVLHDNCISAWSHSSPTAATGLPENRTLWKGQQETLLGKGKLQPKGQRLLGPKELALLAGESVPACTPFSLSTFRSSPGHCPWEVS